MKNILIINGHPVEGSFNWGLAQSYFDGAVKGNFKVSVLNIREMDFNPNLEFAYKKRMNMEPDIENAIQQINASDHLVWVFPLWWYGMPALLKGFVDRTFLPDVAFKTRLGKQLPDKLLKGKTSRIIITADAPKWYDYLYMKRPAINQLKKGILKFSGISPVRVTYISPIKNSSERFRNKWIEKVFELGSQGK